MQIQNLLDQLSRRKLVELISHRSEAECLDFKGPLDLSKTGDIVELAKDIMAMANREGGHIVIGVEDKTGDVVGVHPLLAETLRDGQTITSKISRYCGGKISVNCAAHRVPGREDTEVTVFLLYVPANSELVVASDNGVYVDPEDQKKQKWVFRKGDVFVRKADSSVKMEQLSDLPERLRPGSRTGIGGGRSAIDGEWFSTWQTNSSGEHSWSVEKVRVSSEDAVIKLKNFENNNGYEWQGEGTVVRENYIAGEWRSVRPGATSAGTFILNVDEQGEHLVGFFLGPNRRGFRNFGAWILARTAKALDVGKEVLAETCPGLKEILPAPRIPAEGPVTKSATQGHDDLVV